MFSKPCQCCPHARAWGSSVQATEYKKTKRLTDRVRHSFVCLLHVLWKGKEPIIAYTNVEITLWSIICTNIHKCKIQTNQYMTPWSRKSSHHLSDSMVYYYCKMWQFDFRYKKMGQPYNIYKKHTEIGPKIIKTLQSPPFLYSVDMMNVLTLFVILTVFEHRRPIELVRRW